MEATTFKNEDCVSHWVAKDSPGQPLTHSTTDEKGVSSSSLCLGWVNSTNGSSSEHFTSLHTSPNSNMLGRNIGFPGDLGYTQAFQNAKPHNYLVNFTSPSHLLPPTQAGVLFARKNNENMGIQSSIATSTPLTTQEGVFCQNKEQSPGEQEQLLMHRMEQLQRLIIEQQKIITFYNPGFSVSPVPPHLLPGVPAALFPAQLPLEHSLQVQDERCSQTNPLIMRCNLQQCATRISANSSFSVVSKEHLEPHETGANMESLSQSHETSTDNPSIQNSEGERNAAVKESCPENVPSIEEEKGEDQIDENASLSPFGLRMNTRTQNVDDRPIRPGIGVRQKTFEEFLEEQLQVDSQRMEKNKQNGCETKVTIQKSFLKCGEGTARLEKNRETFCKEPNKLLRRVSFDCQNHFTWPAQWDIGKPLGKHSQLKRRVSSPTVLFLDDKHTNCIIPKDDINGQHNNHEKRLEERKGNHHSGGHDDEEIVNKKESDGKETVNENKSEVPSQINWSKCSQQYFEQINDIKAKVRETTEASCLGSQEHSGRVDNRPIDSKVPWWLMEDSVSQVARRSMDTSPVVFELQKSENNLTNQEDQNYGVQVIQDAIRIGQCKSEHCVTADNSPDIQAEIIPEFKKVNDQIVKITPKPDRKQMNTFANSQTRDPNSVGAANRWKGNFPSESVSTSSDSEDEPKSHCSQYSIRSSTHRAASIGKNMDLSDADYAADEPSGVEDYSLKSHGKSLAKKFDVQELTGQQGASLIASSSSSESSFRDSSLRCGKAVSSLRKSPFHPSQTRGGKESETQSQGIASNSSREFNLQPPSLTRDLVASLFPVFKNKANLEEQVQKKHVSKLEECEQEVPVPHRETSLLAQMKEEQTKAMDFLRRHIKQYEAIRSQRLHPLEECKGEEALKLQEDKVEIEKHPIIVQEEGESEEIQMLKRQIAGLQEEFRRNETRWHVAHGELRSQVKALTKHNLELQNELRVSEPQKSEAERKHGVMDLAIGKTETPVLEAILRGSSSQETLEERPSQDRHKCPSKVHARRGIPLDELPPKDIRNTQTTRGALQRSESLKSATGEQRVKSPSKTLYNRSATPTGRRTPHQMSFELQKALPELGHNQQQTHVRNSPVSASNLTVLKNTHPSLYVEGTYSSTSGSSEDAAILTSKKNDISSSASLTNVKIQLKEKLSHKRAQRSKKPSEQVASTIISRRKSITSNGNKVSAENISTSMDAERKSSPLKPILSRRASLYVESKEDGEVKKKIEYPDGKVKQLFTDGRKIITYPNGTKMEISTDKRTTVVTFYNGDVKKILPDQRVIYYYADAQTTRTIYPNGLEVLQFPNNQIEKYHPDGTEEIVFPDQTVKRHYDGGLEETVFPDGTVVKVEKNGIKTIQFRNGKTEIHTALSTRREYPDGTVKTIYANGQQETKYCSGRARIKDEKGTLIHDKK